LSEEPLLRVVKVTKEFAKGGIFTPKKTVRAVDEVSLEIGRMENVALVGESGCGKSTLGKLTLGLLKPDSGSIIFEGRDIWSMGKKEFTYFRRNAQIIHQDPYTSLNPVRTIFQSLAPPLIRNKEVPDSKAAYERLKELLTMVGLAPPEDFLNRYPARMSGGQMQRIILARAVSLRPKYIVADEAVSMLDASLRLGAVDLMLELQKRFGMSYLFITHDLGIARYFILKGRGKIAMMYLGSIVEAGEGDSVIQKPIHPYTQIMMTAISVPDPRLTRSRPIPKLRSLEVPRLEQVPSGCKFHPRCPYAEKICEEHVPELREFDSRLVACHFAERFT
jgi:oligopeptide/dipeptide ABC transporter ATP-binding protein